MKQKVTTRAVIQQDGKVLLLRRQGGRPSIAGLYELPGGSIHIGQQPDDAIVHALHVHAGVAAETVQLRDVMSFIDPDDRALQYVFVIYDVTLKPSDKTINLSSDYDKYEWKSLQEIQLNKLTQSTQQLLGLNQLTMFPDEHKQDASLSDETNTSPKIVAYSDGGSRGNPGPSASGYVLLQESGEVIAEGGEYLGITTNNVAEYTAVLQGLLRARELGYSEVDFRMDSQLVANQLNGIYKIKHPDLAVINQKIQQVVQEFNKVTFSHVRREYNQLADGVVNRILDENEL